MRTMQSSLRWARGRLVETGLAGQLLDVIEEFLQDTGEDRQIPVSQGYSAPRIRGRVGQPRCLITEEQLQFLLSFNFTVQQIADILGVSRRTVTQRLRQHNITIRGRYSNMTNAELDERVIDLVHGNDELGPDAVRARLFGEGIVVQRRRVRQSLLRTNPAGAALRAMSHRLHRRKYRVAGPNSLWHLDGNHKLIRWRIVIHGGIDGFSRMIVFLQASNNNRSSTVMEQFVQAVDQFDVPSRVRCDHGGENNAVCLFMDVFRGTARGSALRGRSTHNQRIERLWRDVWNGLSNVYHSLFTLLEQDGILDINSETHLWALQYVYMPRIDRDLQHFVNQWNHHGLRTTRYMSPYRMFVRGCLRLQSQNLTGVQGLFGADEGPADEQPAEQAVRPPVPTFNWPERVAVPANTFAVEPGRLQELQHRVDPLAGSRDGMGVDLLQEVLSFLLS